MCVIVSMESKRNISASLNDCRMTVLKLSIRPFLPQSMSLINEQNTQMQ
jgi:hypothetical protein